MHCTLQKHIVVFEQANVQLRIGNVLVCPTQYGRLMVIV